MQIIKIVKIRNIVFKHKYIFRGHCSNIKKMKDITNLLVSIMYPQRVYEIMEKYVLCATGSIKINIYPNHLHHPPQPFCASHV